MSPERRGEVKVTITLAVSVATLIGGLGFFIHMGRTLERLDNFASHAIGIEDAKDWVACTERMNTNWIGADIWTIWDRNHAKRGGVIGAIP